MNAFQLHNDKGKPTGIWCCGECRKLVLSPLWTANRDNPKSTKEAADICCDPNGRMYCFTCKAICMGVQHGECKLCRDKADAKRREERAISDRKRLENAQDVTDSYDGPVYIDGYSGDWGEGFFSSVEAVHDYLDHLEIVDLPEFAFCCESRIERLDLDFVIENLCSDGYEDMENRLTIPESLKAAVAEFNELNRDDLTVWNTDYKRKVRLTPAIAAAD